MTFPGTALLLLALPLLAAALILGVSYVRRHVGRRAHARAEHPGHRLQSDTAAVQDAEARRTRASASGPDVSAM